MAKNGVLFPALKKKQGFFYGYVTVGLCFFVLMIMWGLTYTYGIFFKPVSEEFGWTRAMTSGAFSLYSVLHGALYIVTGKLNDRFGPRAVVTACGLFLGVGFLLMSWTTSLWQLYLNYGVLMGIGLSGGMVPMASTVARWFVKRRGLATGIALSGIGLGIVVTPPVAEWLISTRGWRSCYFLVGMAALIIITVLAQFFKRDPARMGQLPYGVSREMDKKAATLVPQGLSLKEALRTSQLWIFSGIFVCLAALTSGVVVHFVPFVTDLGISPGVGAAIMSLIGGMSIVGRLVTGVIADRAGRRAALLTVTIVEMAAFLLLIPAREVPALWLFGVLFGFAWGAGNVLLSPVTAELFGLKSHGAILGVVGALATVGGGALPLLAGFIYDRMGDYLVAFVAFAAVSFMALILTLLLKSAPLKSAEIK